MNEAEEKRMREEFEEWAESIGLFISKNLYDHGYEYTYIETEFAWESWKAALAYQDKMIMAAYADALQVRDDQLKLNAVAFAEKYRGADGFDEAVTNRTPDDARRKMEEMKR